MKEFRKNKTVRKIFQIEEITYNGRVVKSLWEAYMAMDRSGKSFFLQFCKEWVFHLEREINEKFLAYE